VNTKIPFTYDQINRITKTYPTPFYIYDEAKIRGNSVSLYNAMKVAGFKNFKNYFAVKALPNPQILKILSEEAQGMDASSVAELMLCKQQNISDVMFTSNNTTDEEFKIASEMGAIINFDDITHVRRFIKKFGAPSVASCRYNPGNISFADADESIIGKPAEAKYGMTKAQIFDAYKLLKEAGVKKFGLHTMLLSNDLHWQNHVRIANLMFKLAAEIANACEINFEFINLGGGIGVAYRPQDDDFNIKLFAEKTFQAYISSGIKNLGSPNVVMENGRYITADAGFLITRVINKKDTYKKYIGVDASMANLMRPGMYGAYHHITVLSKNHTTRKEVVDVTGSLCENNDKFAIDRELPRVEIGDYLVVHTAGAHGHAMGFQYNGKLRSAELLLCSDKSTKIIRRAETLDDYFSTLDLKRED
jgi:diaminopimelate decarboxylase